MATARRENKVERVKRERDGLDCLQDLLERYARDGFASITEEDLDVRLRWYGLYTQRPKDDGHFMLRIKVPNGTLGADQLEAIGALSVRYGRNTGDITTRQDIQLHYVRIEDTPAIFAELERIGLTTSGACGDITRNVTGCPLAGIAADELLDVEPYVVALHEHFLNNREFSNLPRKFKITVSACASQCTNHEINDIGLVALVNDDGRIVFDLWVGGGLGARERFADRLGAHIAPEEIIEVCHHICAIFRDAGSRVSRAHARLKFLLEEWGPEKFRHELENRLGRKLTDGDAAPLPTEANRAHIGIYPQKQDGAYYAGAATKRGRFPGTDMIAVARLARASSATTRIRLTTTQNLVLLDVPASARERVAGELRALDLHTTASSFRTGTLACTGKQFCKLSVTETKERASDLIEHLERAFPDFADPLRISVTGCPNSCAHYQVCDIGFVGDLVKTADGPKEGYRIYLGGHLGAGHAFGRELEKKILADEIKFYVERITRVYLAGRASDENFQTFIKRHASEELETLDVIGARASEAV